MKFTVKNLGKIKEANIELRQLTIFVGKNGTQKSYMAHVIYSLATWLKPRLPFRMVVRRYIKNALLEHFGKKIEKEKEIFLKSEDVQKLAFEVLDSLNKDVSKKAKEVFNSAHYFDKLDIKLELDLKKKKFEDIEALSKEGDFILVEDDFEYDSYEESVDEISAYEVLIEKLEAIVIYIIQENIPIYRDVYYFPSSRTGFVLAFDDIIAGVFRERFGGRSTTKLTKPFIDFLSNFADIKADRFFGRKILPLFLREEKSPNKIEVLRLIRFLQERILKGEIIEKKEEDKYLSFLFKPYKSENELELHITSSATVELLPIIEFIKNSSSLKNKLFIIEEPEAHLHPKAQIEMARFLAMLANSGAKVLITTHSDYIIHEISNCIKLFNLKEKYKKQILKKENLENYTDIAISQDKVSVYLFKENEKIIEVEKLNVDRFGIEDKNFEDVVDELFERTTILGERLIESTRNSKDS